MKLLKRIQPKLFVVFMALFLASVSLFAGLNMFHASAEDVEMPAEITYIDTEVEGIAFSQHPSCVFLGFKLTESDYSDFGQFEGDFAGKDSYETYEKYIRLWLTYWENFPQMNSEGVRFDQLYAYWDGSSVGYGRFAGTVAHRSTLKLLEYGFVISIPAGTTFPSATYVQGDCEGTPIMYRTTEDAAFYYNGTSFVTLDYRIAQVRADAEAELSAINNKLYNTAERAMVNSLIAEAKEDLKLCFTTFDIEDRLAQFYADLDKIMTKEDYENLAARKEEIKASWTTFFAGFAQADYDAEEWQTITAIEQEGKDVLDTLMTFDEVEAMYLGVKFAAESVLTKEEKAAVAAYRTAAIARLEGAFVSSAYREAEKAQGAALVQEGKQALGKTNDYQEIDAVESSYISRINALKTKAQWEDEEKKAAQEQENNKPPVTENNNNNNVTSSEKEGGCSSVIGGAQMVLCVALMATAIGLKKKERMED